LRVALADYLVWSKRYEEASKELDSALQADAKNARALQLKADLQIAKNDWPAAEESLKKLKAALPQQPIGYYRLGLAYQAQKKYDQALVEFETAQAKAPGAADSLTAIVNVLLAQGKPDKALASLNQAVQAAPDRSAPYVLLGDLYVKQNRYPEAEKALRKAVQIDQKAPAPYWGLAKLYLVRRDTKAAIEVLQQGLNASPGDRVLLQALAEIYLKIGNIDSAITEYERILHNAPLDDIAANKLASLMVEAKGDKASLERALELTKRFESSSDPSLLDTRGRVYFKLGQNDQALPLFERAAASSPKAPVFQYHLGMAYYQLGDTKSAKTHLQRALDAKADFAGIEEAKAILAKL
jgi:tetratricopeptide (TPR) repeat protein